MFTRSLLGLVAISVWLLGCGAKSPVTTNALPVGDALRTVWHQGLKRGYLVHVPPGYNRDRPAAVVVVLHGGGSHASAVAELTAFDRLSDQAGFLVVYPNGTGRLRTILTWNGGTCCGHAQQHNMDDVGFIRAIIADLKALAAVDPRRIYATGFSNGAIMAYRLACEASDLVAAIGPVAGTQNLAPCRPQEPVSVVHFHGTNDTHLPYDGGVGAESWAGVAYASVHDSIQFWVNANRCRSAPVSRTVADARHVAYTGCAAGSAVELYTIVGGGHAWPGGRGPAWRRGDPPTRLISATQVIWEFFAAHPKP